MVWSFFLFHSHLWSVLSFFATGIYVQSLSFTAFSAVGIRVRPFVFALLALVSGYQCISGFGIMLCACCSSASSLEIRTGIFFQVGYPVDCPTNSALKQTQQTPFVYLAVAQRQPIRVGCKVLQLLQSGCRGERADTDLERIEI